ncbi:MAG: fatty acid desaturase family protein [Bdellovibrio sp.]|nr:fatty acid desaturase family protein [Bdellovibrio sp.]
MKESTDSQVKIQQLIAAEDLHAMDAFVESHRGASDVQSLFRMFFDYAVISVCIALSIFFDSTGVFVLTILIIAGRQHGLMMLIHEAVHGHLHSNRKANDFLAEFFCSLPLMINFQGYRWNHLTHHLNLNSENDPDWARKSDKGWVFPKSFSALVGFFLKEVFLELPRGRILRVWNMLTSRKISAKRRMYIWIFYGCQFGVLIYFGWISEYLLYWIVPLWLVVPFMFLVRSIAEHFALPYKSELTSSRDIEASFFNQIFIPHHGGYHLTHHLYPFLPAYRLKNVSEYLRKNQEFSKHSEYNDGYFFGSNTLLNRILKKK